MDKVYVVNHGSLNYENAKQYGTLVHVTEDKFPIFKITYLTETLKDRLKDFKEDDYLLLSGPAWLNIVASSILMTKYDSIKFLIFDAKQQEYVVRHLNKSNLGGF